MNVNSAKKAVEFVTLAKNLADGTVYRVPGHNRRVYFVKVSPDWENENGLTVHVTCRRVVKGRRIECPGNSKHTICYHALAAVLFHFKDDSPRICESVDDAERLARIKGRVIRIESTQGSGLTGVVVRGMYKKEKERAEIARIRMNGQMTTDAALYESAAEYLELTERLTSLGNEEAYRLTLIRRLWARMKWSHGDVVKFVEKETAKRKAKEASKMLGNDVDYSDVI